MGDGTFDNPWLFVDDGSTIHAIDDDFDEETQTLDTLPDDQRGPNRVTVWVPTDETTLNVGADYPGAGAVPPLDDGIAGRTRDHVHFHVMGRRDGAEPHENRRATWVRLGAPISSASALPLHSTDGILWSAEPDFHNAWSGYSMLTRGGAVQESYLDHVLASTAGDLRLAGRNVVTIGSPRDVLIAVYGDRPMSDFLDSAEGRSEDPSAPGRDKIHRDVVRAVNAASSVVSTDLGIWYSTWQVQSGYNRAVLSGESGWDSMAPFDGVATGIGYSAALLPFLFYVTEPLTDVPGSNRLDLFSSGKVGLLAEQTVSIGGTMFVGVTSPSAVLVSGGGFLGLSTQGYSKYSASLMAIGAIFKLDVESQQGPLTLRARKDIEISSRAAGIKIVGEKTIQINSNEEEIWLFGKKGFYLGAGGGALIPPSTPFAARKYAKDRGWGVWGDEQHVTVGFLHPATSFEGRAHQSLAQGLRLDKDALQLTKENNKIRMDANELSVKRGDYQLKITDSDIVIEGDRVQIA